MNEHEKKHEIIIRINCPYCDKQFSSKRSKQRHVIKEHQTEINIGVLLISNESTEEESAENVLKVCPIPQKFKYFFFNTAHDEKS